MDTVSKAKRSDVMRHVRGKDTKPELVVRRLTHAMGYRYRLHEKTLPGRPDLAFISRKKVIFVHGCMWHGHEGCPNNRRPRSRKEYWYPKLDANIRRDAENLSALSKLGWQSLAI